MQDTLSLGEPEADQSIMSLAAAWPDGVPGREAAIWKTLDPSARTLAIERIAALVNYEDEGGWLPNSRRLGLSKPGFFSLLRRWRENRSIASVVPDVKPKGGGRKGRGVSPSDRKLLGEMFANRREWSRERIVSEIQRTSGDRPSAGALRALIDELEVERNRAKLGPAAFGTRIVIGTCPAVLRPTKAIEWRPTAHAGFVVDVSTGEILGYATHYLEEAAFRQACLNAASAVAAFPGESSDTQEPRFDCYVAGDAIATLGEMKRLSELPLHVAVFDGNSRRQGSRIVQLLGNRLGVLDLRPRGEVPSANLQNRDEDGPDAAEVVAIRLAEEVERRAAKRSGPLPPMAVRPGALADALRMVAG